MAAQSSLDLAERLVRQLNAHESQGSLESQALDMAPIVYALGYKHLASVLRQLGHGAVVLGTPEKLP